jgi:cation diffusion facilitator family transporter
MERIKETRKLTFICVAGNILLTILKFIAGFLGKSAAMMADASHSLSDILTDIVLLFGVEWASKPADKEHPYGHARIETLCALFISVFLLFVAGAIFFVSFKEILQVFKGNTLVRPGYIALIMAFLSIVVKELMYQYSVKVGHKINSLAVMANAWHHRSDAFSSLAALIGIGGAIFLGGKWTVLDPLVGIVISILIIIIALKMIKNAVDEIIDRALPSEDIKKIKEIALSIEGIKNPHEIKTRRSGYKIFIDLHIDIDKETTFIKAHDKTTLLENELKKVYGKHTVIIVHAEPI